MSRCTLLALSIGLWALSACTTVQYISVDYLTPAKVLFPDSIRRVAVVNNINIGALNIDSLRMYGGNDIHVVMKDDSMACEELAAVLAECEYFDEVMICDSALRADDVLPRAGTLEPWEVEDLSADLGVDCLIAFEHILLKLSKTGHYYPEMLAVVDVAVTTTVSIYIPGLDAPFKRIVAQDSIFWEGAVGALPSDEQIIEEAALFAGSVPAKSILPQWTTVHRYYFAYGGKEMKQAAALIKDYEDWEKAIVLWRQAYEKAGSNSKKMLVAHNIALYYEMQDDLEQALQWATKAETHYASSPIRTWIIPNYVNSLKRRLRELPDVQAQMRRFE